MKSQSAYSPPQKLKSNKDIEVEFTGINLTKFDGIQLVKKFLRRLNVSKEKSHSRERFIQLIGKVWELSYFRLKVKGIAHLHKKRRVFGEEILLDRNSYL